MRLAARPDANETRGDMLAMRGQVAGRLEAHARDDATLLITALRDHEQQIWPFPPLDPLAPPVRHQAICTRYHVIPSQKMIGIQSSS